MTREDWFNAKGIDFLKFRASWGLTGKDNIDNWGWLQTYGMNNYYGAVFGTSMSNPIGSGISMSQAPNRNAHWDKNYKTNFGFDLRTLRNRLSVGFDFYYDMGREMFAQRRGADLPSTVGSPLTPDNYAEMDMWGIELALGWKDRIGPDFSYFVNVNTGYSDNKVKKAYWQEGIDKVQPNGRIDTGRWGYECLGIFQTYQQIAEYFADNHITSYMGYSIDGFNPGIFIYKDQ
ncbi:MAG: SusC/RagA family protein, partial [Rikenellaceae bacterium]|nr:SusC/RagA family protein [Rikenellaceae bacterium]